MRCLPLAAACMLAASGVAAHPFHESQTEIDYRSTCQCLEITLRVKPEEMEAELQRNGAARLPLEHPRMQQELQEYVRQHFVLSDAAQQAVPLTWVGLEIDALGAWIYLQSTSVKVPLQLRNDVLLDYDPEQVNRVLFRLEGQRQGLSFSRATPPVQTLRGAGSDAAPTTSR